MGMFDNYRVNKAINKLLSLPDPKDPEMFRTVAWLQQAGQPTVIPKLIEALEDTCYRANAIAALAQFLNDNNIAIFLSEFRQSKPYVCEGLLEVFQSSTNYDPNKLISLCTDPKVSSSKLEHILISRKHLIKFNNIIKTLPTISKNHHTTIFKLINQVICEDSISELIPLLHSSNQSIRFGIARILCRFKTPIVQESFIDLLNDTHNQLRLVALEGLIAMDTNFSTEILCRLICDSDPSIQQYALNQLLKIIRSGSETERCIKILNAVEDPNTIKKFFIASKDEEWRTACQIAKSIGLHGSHNLIEITTNLFVTNEGYIQRLAFEAICSIEDKQLLFTVANSLQDKNIRDKLVFTMASLEDERMLPLLMRFLDCDENVAIIALRIFATLNEPKTILPVSKKLSNTSKSIVQEALQTLSIITNAEHAPEVLKAVMSVRDNDEEDVKELANKTATAIIKRFGRKVLPHSAAEQMIEQLPISRQIIARSAQTAPEVSPPTINHNKAHSTTVDCASIEPGIILADRYRVIRRVGEGGFSSVFLVDDTMVNEEVILKILNPQIAAGDEMIKRFIQELRYARKVTHENVIRIHDIITLGHSYAISMEYFPSHTLAHELQVETALNLKRGVKIIFDVCRGIGAAHQVSIVHRDLKPLNILINDQGMVKVVDFGVAAVTSNVSTRLTRVGTLLGTPAYVAPEQVRSRTIDARTDIYSLGVVMYEVFTGKVPYDGDDMSILFQHVEGNLTPPCQINPNIPLELDGIIRKAMDVDPDRRFQSMDELRKSLVGLSRQIM